ncbi:MAG TPA: hypothetical protein VMR70_10555, partial [Flavisolibacter sp.]|nr:hypothetical protein [Flavisolibacter sp.]
MKQFYFSLAALLAGMLTHAQYTQNFDNLVNSGSGTYDVLPEGWGIYEVYSGSGSGASIDGKYIVANGSNNAGNAYSFGTTNSTDRALGTIASNQNFPTLGAIFFNETDNPITSVTITYTGEQWRYGGRSFTAPATAAPKDVLRFEYSLDAAGIVNNVGTWVRVTELDFESIITTPSTTTGVALDGNAPANRKLISYT